MSALGNIEEQQRDRFNKYVDEYNERHAHPAAQKYRDQTYRKNLFSMDLDGKEVLDGMCATGIDTPFFMSRGAQVTGLDISDECCAAFETQFDRPCVVRSMSDTGFADEQFDMVFIGGGLHHINHLIGEVIEEVHRILKPGGYFCAFEPNADDWSNRLREMWYKRDHRFEDNERAISYDREVKPSIRLGFEEEVFFQAGNIAYMPLLQSGMLKLPTSILSKIDTPLINAENVVSRLPFAPKLYFAFRWRKSI
jgi:SAM-dependent methyltransferase